MQGEDAISHAPGMLRSLDKHGNARTSLNAIERWERLTRLLLPSEQAYTSTLTFRVADYPARRPANLAAGRDARRGGPTRTGIASNNGRRAAAREARAWRALNQKRTVSFGDGV